jgi:hypothetical protein
VNVVAMAVIVVMLIPVYFAQRLAGGADVASGAQARAANEP